MAHGMCVSSAYRACRLAPVTDPSYPSCGHRQHAGAQYKSAPACCNTPQIICEPCNLEGVAKGYSSKSPLASSGLRKSGASWQAWPYNGNFRAERAAGVASDLTFAIFEAIRDILWNPPPSPPCSWRTRNFNFRLLLRWRSHPVHTVKSEVGAHPPAAPLVTVGGVDVLYAAEPTTHQHTPTQRHSIEGSVWTPQE